MQTVFQRELKQLGLNEKEAAVYEASLTLGPATVQQISQKSKIARATTYLIIDSLKRKQLAYEIKEPIKTLVGVEPPAQLSRLLDEKEQEIHIQRHLLQQVLPQLSAVQAAKGRPPIIRFYEGVNGIKTIRSEMVRGSAKSGTWDSIVPADEVVAAFGPEALHDRERIARKIHSRTIYATDAEELRKELQKTAKEDLSERKFISVKRFPGASGFVIFDQRLAVGTFANGGGAVLIDSPSIVMMMEAIFNTMWRDCH